MQLYPSFIFIFIIIVYFVLIVIFTLFRGKKARAITITIRCYFHLTKNLLCFLKNSVVQILSLVKYDTVTRNQEIQENITQDWDFL